MRTQQNHKTGGIVRYASPLTALLLTAALVVAATPASAQAEPRVFEGEDACDCGVEYSLSTGARNGYTPDLLGELDQHWELVNAPPGVPTGDVFSIEPDHPWATSPDANWVNPWSNTSGWHIQNNPWAPLGDYTYRLYFKADVNQYKDLWLDILVGTDNQGAVFLNGNQISTQTTSYNYLTQVTAPITQYMNTLTVTMTNTGLYTGLLVVGGVTGDCLWNDAGELSYDVSTGTDGNTVQGYGQADPDWNTANWPTNHAGNAYTIEPLPYWVSSSKAGWINAFHEQVHSGIFLNAPENNRYDAPAGTYIYKLDFYLPPAASDHEMTLRFAADNGVQFRLNGHSIGGVAAPGGALAWHNLVANDQTIFNPGAMNQLTAWVDNDGDWTGFIVEGSVTTTCDPCHHEHDDPIGPGGPFDPESPWPGGPIPADPLPGDGPLFPGNGTGVPLPSPGSVLGDVGDLAHDIGHGLLGDH